jgi:hypothetical protein
LQATVFGLNKKGRMFVTGGGNSRNNTPLWLVDYKEFYEWRTINAFLAGTKITACSILYVQL